MQHHAGSRRSFEYRISKYPNKQRGFRKLLSNYSKKKIKRKITVAWRKHMV